MEPESSPGPFRRFFSKGVGLFRYLSPGFLVISALSFATYGDTGYLLGHFVRDTAHLGLEAAVKKITADPANLWGMGNRGMLREGFIADITVFDESVVDRGAEYFVQDVPGDGYRYVRDAHGIHSVVIGGALAYDKANGYYEAHRGQVIG